jgi:hypothetical protein
MATSDLSSSEQMARQAPDLAAAIFLLTHELRDWRKHHDKENEWLRELHETERRILDAIALKTSTEARLVAIAAKLRKTTDALERAVKAAA